MSQPNWFDQSEVAFKISFENEPKAVGMEQMTALCYGTVGEHLLQFG